MFTLHKRAHTKPNKRCLCTTVIEFNEKGKKLIDSSGTGFFFKHDEKTFLITNCHVLIDEDSGHYPEELEIVIHDDLLHLAKYHRVKIPLYNGSNPRWLQHPKGKEIDVAAIDITNDLIASGSPPPIEFWSPDDFYPPNAIMDVGELMIAMGYPLLTFDKDNYLPISRSGTLASTYGVGFQKEPVYLIDGSLQPGMSGSPVTQAHTFKILTPLGLTFSASGLNYLLGIYSSTLMGYTGASLDLQKIWYARLIMDIINQNSDEYDSIMS